ncbi:MAG: 4'-phosphopantetheinyl transferase superfamily protein [Planctomycetes bacterium]|nr:4'-phosphopantetheinyl transferase superfamily protein [Planctomycetota bacterium]
MLTALPVGRLAEATREDFPFVPPIGTVVVWHARAAGSTDLAQCLQSLLPDERARADQFRHEEARADFVTTRAHLRVLLGQCLGMAPSRVALRTTAQGKPFLADWQNPSRLRFNVSHSHGHILIALARGLEIGVDVEPVRSLPDMDAVARDVMTHEEHFLYDISRAKKPETFFRVWTRKEAILKAAGCGLLHSLRQTESLLRRAAIQHQTRTGQPVTSLCRLRSFDTQTGALGAIAARGGEFELQHFRMDC